MVLGLSPVDDVPDTTRYITAVLAWAAEFGLSLRRASRPGWRGSTVVGNITGGPNLVVSLATSNPYTLVAEPLLDDKPPQIIESDIAEPVDVQLAGEWPAWARSEGFWLFVRGRVVGVDI